ncbi:MAG TPA: GntR family transcriptional regulator, partial [Chloroflexi bacterium]|nr:GntR family transcriptional regulator [Chloroflexota bacterium]
MASILAIEPPHSTLALGKLCLEIRRCQPKPERRDSFPLSQETQGASNRSWCISSFQRSSIITMARSSLQKSYDRPWTRVGSLTSTGLPWDEVCQLCCLLSDIIIRAEVDPHMVIEDLPRVLSTYEQVEQALSRLVEHLKPGDQLPSEPELARQLGVSRATLREVLRTFTERGILIRRQGIGTFVASRLPLLEAGLEVLESLNEMAQNRGLTTQ